MSIRHPARARGAMGGPIGLLVSFSLAILLVFTAAPAAFAQDAGEPLPLLMGQLGTGTFAAGESVSYLVDLPESTIYIVATGDDVEAAKFTLVITDRRDKEVYNDVFKQDQVELSSGDHVFTLTANEDATLSFFVTGQTGELSTDYGEGTLDNGSFASVENVNETQYAELDIEDSDFWQQAFVTASGNEGDSYSISVSGDDAYASVGDSSIEGPAVFWTKGGRYHVEVTPVAGGDSLTVVVLLSGPVPELTVGEETPGTMQPGSPQKPYRFTVDEAGIEYTINLASDTTDVDLDLSASINPTTDTWSSYNSGSNETLSFVAPVAGEYYLRIYTSGTIVDPVDYTVQVDKGEPAAAIVPGVQVWETVPAGGKSIHVMPIEAGDQLLSISLVADPDVDLDLSAQIIDDAGNSVGSMSGYNSGSFEALAQAVRDGGLLQVEVDGTYATDDTPFVLLVTLDPAGAIAAQWASDASASSQYGDTSYTPLEATGEPNVALPSDNPLSWTSKDPDGGEETLELSYEHLVVPTGIRIFESYNPGAISRIEAFDPDSERWTDLWKGESATDEEIRVFSPPIESPDFKTNLIRLTLQTDLVPGWNEIDAVQLLGLP